MKPCPFCAEQIQDQAIKCRFCGSMLDGSSPIDAAARVAPGASAPVEIIFQGSPSWKAWFGSHVLVAVLCLLPLGICWAGFLSHLAWATALIAAGACVAVALIWALVLVLQRKSTLYRLSTRTLDIEYGILSKRIETLQLWRVRDLDLRQSVMERLLSVVCIRVFTKDMTDPQIVLRGLPASREIFDKLKDAAELARQQRVVGMVE